VKLTGLKLRYGDWALITGASSGIGEEFARALASERINLVLVARRKNRLENLSNELSTKNNINVITSITDLTSDNFLDKIIRDAEDKDISILINNAGIGKPGEFIKGDINYDSDMIKLNCMAPVVLTNYFAKKMILKKKGAIIFLGSVVAYQPSPMMASYAATKSFNFSFGNALWYELKKYGIDVLTVNPGNTITEFNRMVLDNKSILTRNASQVVKSALKSLGKKPNVVDGAINKILTSFSRAVSVRLIVNITGIIMNKLYGKNYLANKSE
jgi:short-subunit dehydrogenase